MEGAYAKKVGKDRKTSQDVSPFFDPKLKGAFEDRFKELTVKNLASFILEDCVITCDKLRNAFGNIDEVLKHITTKTKAIVSTHSRVPRPIWQPSSKK